MGEARRHGGTEAWSAVLAALLIGVPALAQQTSQVVLAWDDSGDFGPATPGTTTAGWQEALDFCASNRHDLYVKGGSAGQAVYSISDTVVFPPIQDFRVDGGVYTVDGSGLDNFETAIRIDSMMNGTVELGIIEYFGSGTAVIMRPQLPVPVDNFPTVVESKVFFHGIRGAGSGTGILFDTIFSGIVYSQFTFASVRGFNMGMDLQGVYSCEITCSDFRTSVNGATLIRTSSAANGNLYRLNMSTDPGTTGVIGFNNQGVFSEFDLTVLTGGFASGSELLLAGTGNKAVIRNLGAENFVTNTGATNEVDGHGAGPAIHTVNGAAGFWVYNQRSYPAVINVTSGTPTTATITRPTGGSVTYSNPVGRDFFLGVNDSISLSGGSAPTITVIPQ